MDLSHLPEPARSRMQEQLARLPAELRATLESKLAKLPAEQLEAVLQKSAPMLERLAGKPGGKVGASVQGPGSAGGKSVSTHSTGFARAPTVNRPYDPHDHYNTTIQRGDRATPPLFVIMFLVACAAVFARAIGWF